MRRFRLLNLVLGASVLVASLYPFGLDLLFVLFSPRALHAAFGSLLTMLIAIAFKYLLLAVPLYVLARRIRFERRFNLRAQGRWLLLTGTVLALLLSLPELYRIGIPPNPDEPAGGVWSALLYSGGFVFAIVAMIVGLIRMAAAQSLPKRFARRGRSRSG